MSDDILHVQKFTEAQYTDFLYDYPRRQGKEPLAYYMSLVRQDEISDTDWEFTQFFEHHLSKLLEYDEKIRKR